MIIQDQSFRRNFCTQCVIIVNGFWVFEITKDVISEKRKMMKSRAATEIVIFIGNLRTRCSIQTIINEQEVTKETINKLVRILRFLGKAVLMRLKCEYNAIELK